DSKDYTIAPASSSTTITVAGATYDANAHGATVLTTGAGGLGRTSATLTYSGRPGTTYPASASAPSGAGDYTVAANYAGDANHSGSTDSKDYTIAPASSSTTITVAGATYDANAHGATVLTTGAGG